MDVTKPLPYVERAKLENGWKRYCVMTNNQQPTIAQFIGWLQSVKGLRLTPAKQVVVITTQVAAGAEVKTD